MKTTVETKAEHLVVLYLLDQENLVEGLTQQEIADLFGYSHRSSGLRLLNSLGQIKIEYSRFREFVIMLHAERGRKCRYVQEF